MGWGKKPDPKNPKNKASTHKHDDLGGSEQKGDWLYTYCRCGAQVAKDFNPGDNPRRK